MGGETEKPRPVAKALAVLASLRGHPRSSGYNSQCQGLLPRPLAGAGPRERPGWGSVSVLCVGTHTYLAQRGSDESPGYRVGHLPVLHGA